jgi:hypothetical protein
MITIVSKRDTAFAVWWAATLVWRFEIEGVDYGGPGRRCREFRNTVFFRAADRELARLRAIDRGLEDDTCSSDWINEKTGQRGRWIFAGLAGLDRVARGTLPEPATEDSRLLPVSLVRPWLRRETAKA